MAKGKKEETASERNVVDPESISLVQGLEIPPQVRSSKYDWDVLAEDEPGATALVVQCDSEDDANRLRPSVYQSGKNYYDKRSIDRRPLVRVIEYDGNWVVAAWAVEPKNADAEEEED